MCEELHRLAQQRARVLTVLPLTVECALCKLCRELLERGRQCRHHVPVFDPEVHARLPRLRLRHRIGQRLIEASTRLAEISSKGVERGPVRGHLHEVPQQSTQGVATI